MDLSFSQEELNATLFKMLFTLLEEQHEMKIMLYSLIASSTVDSKKLYEYVDSEKTNFKDQMMNSLFEKYGEISPEIYSLLKIEKK